MLAYAASRPTPVERRPHPNTMLAIIAAHVAVAAVVMSAKMDLPDVVKHTPIDIFWVKPPDTTPPPDLLPTQRTHQSQSHQVDRVEPVVTTPPQGADPFDPGPITTVNPGPIAGAGTNIVTELPRPHSLVRLGPTLRTSPAEMKPPYPPSKLLTEEEAVLRLKLTIDERGRVVSVDPVGRADRAFLDAARRHLLAHWRYSPATEDGKAVASSTVITLRFELDG